MVEAAGIEPAVFPYISISYELTLAECCHILSRVPAGSGGRTGAWSAVRLQRLQRPFEFGSSVPPRLIVINSNARSDARVFQRPNEQGDVMNRMKQAVEPPKTVVEVERRGFAVWAEHSFAPEFVAKFEAYKIPVAGVRLVRTWGIQVDDERELPGHERSYIPDEETWMVILVAKDGSHFEVAADCVAATPE